MTSLRANGKFLLTGEYLVLHGALSLALPLKLGQSLSVETADDDMVKWTARQPSGLWFDASFDAKTLDLIQSTDAAKARFVARLLQIVKKKKPHLFDKGLVFNTLLDFDPQWGMGSSSTLISNVARWAAINPYQLLADTFGGSGYDIACAEADSPIFYSIVKGSPTSREADFRPPFRDSLFFVYQGKKQSSANEVKGFLDNGSDNYLKYMSLIGNISTEMVKSDKLDDFCRLVDEHEAIMSECLGKPRLKSRFSDFEGSVKSLGAWGGDFMLAASAKGRDYVADYFARRDMNVVLGYEEVVL